LNILGARSAVGNNGDGLPGRRRSANPSSGRLLPPSDFFSGLRKALKARLPQELRGYETSRGHGRLFKLHYGHPEFHYEAWHHTGAGRFEVGLHFEGSAEANQSAFDFFRSRMVEVKARLPRAELEPWDRGWSRMYETVAAPQLDEAVLDDAGDRLCLYITTLEPLMVQFLRR
jgi:hypothetical protein